jgi:hypothetical protein
MVSTRLFPVEGALCVKSYIREVVAVAYIG